ncbi:hypothetical protein [Amycolatopsis sp. NPDC049868]|uniref:hypothetical protein n=1 Tax=Amycolatopsis sp. NPDC049868 TaxID=3363934 RepID=UPI0037BC95ED
MIGVTPLLVMSVEDEFADKDRSWRACTSALHHFDAVEGVFDRAGPVWQRQSIEGSAAVTFDPPW